MKLKFESYYGEIQLLKFTVMLLNNSYYSLSVNVKRFHI